MLPLDDRRIERFNSDLAGRPVLVKGNSQILYGGMGRLSENSVLNLKNKSHSVTAEIVVPDGGGNGVIIAQGGAFAGWCPLPPRGQAEVLPQPRRTAALLRRGRHRRARRRAPGADGVRLRRRRPRQGRHRHPLHRRRQGRRGPNRGDRADDLLRRRDLRRRLRLRHAGQRGLHQRRPATSTARSNGCSSTPASTTTTT